MGLLEFSQDIRTPRSLFDYTRRVLADSALDTPTRQRKALRSAVWLAPRSVRSLDARDFPELGPERQQELATRIAQFLELARQVPGAAIPTEEQFAQGMETFSRILELVGRYSRLHPEEVKVHEVIYRFGFPDWVVNCDPQLKDDWVGDPSVYVWLVLGEEAPTMREIVSNFGDWERELPERFHAVGVARRAYVHIQYTREYRSM